MSDSERAYALRDVYLCRILGFFPTRQAAEDEMLRQKLLGQPHMLEVVRRDEPARRHDHEPLYIEGVGYAT